MWLYLFSMEVSVHCIGPETMALQEQWAHLRLISWFLPPLPTKRNQGSLEKWLIPVRTRTRETQSWSLDFVPERKEILKEPWGHVKRTYYPAERAPPGQIWDNSSNKWVMGVTDYNPLNKARILEFRDINQKLNKRERKVLSTTIPTNKCRRKYGIRKSPSVNNQ